MRKLTLDEKISIKGGLASKGVLPGILLTLDTRLAANLYWRCFGTPVMMHSTPKSWRPSHWRRRDWLRRVTK